MPLRAENHVAHYPISHTIACTRKGVSECTASVNEEDEKGEAIRDEKTDSWQLRMHFTVMSLVAPSCSSKLISFGHYQRQADSQSHLRQAPFVASRFTTRDHTTTNDRAATSSKVNNNTILGIFWPVQLNSRE